MKEIWTCLIRIKTKDGFRSHLIEKPTFTLGRTQEADLPIVDSSVSRVHLTVIVKDEFIWVSDHKSANGTYLNEERLEPGQSFAIKPEDTIKLGTLGDEFQFFAVPKPFELLDLEAQKGVLLNSMEDVAAQIEQRSRAEVERELKSARLEVERLLSQAKRDVEILRTNEQGESQRRRSEVESALHEMRQIAQAEASKLKLAASKEADRLVTEAQMQIRNDYDESSAKIENQLKSAQQRSTKLVADAEARAEGLLAEAREESGRVRLEASEESRRLHQEALRKSRETLGEMQEKLQSEVSAKRAEMLAAVQLEADKDRARIEKEHSAQRESLKAQRRATEDAVAALSKENDELTAHRNALKSEYEALREKHDHALSVAGKVDELESRESKLTAALKELEAKHASSESDFAAKHSAAMKELEASRTERSSQIENEIREKRERGLMDLDARKTAAEAELAKARLVALEQTRQAVAAEQKNYEANRKLRALEVSQKLYERFLPQLETWAANPSAANLSLKETIDAEVKEVLVGEQSSISFVTPAEGTVEKRARFSGRMKQAAMVGIAGFAVAVAFSGKRMMHFLEESQKESGAGKMLENRRIQSLYSPQQTPEYRPTYTENVLYMKGYFDTKNDPAFSEKWTMKLNDLNFIRPMGLNEEDVVKFIAKETNLVQRLGALRGSIDAVYLNEGLERMRNAEAEDVAAIKDILHGEDNYKKIRALEESLLKEALNKTP